MSHAQCFQCRKELDLKPKQLISRQEECPHCYASLKVCKMCHFYDKSAYNECSEPAAERIVEKEKPNFCGFFIFSNPKTEGQLQDEKDQQESAAEALFKNLK